MRKSISITVVVLTFAGLLVAATGASVRTASPPACTAAAALRPYIAQARSTLDDGPAVATHTVRVRLDFHAAANGSYPSVDSLEASAPPGVRISAGEDWSEWIVVGQAAGTVPLGLSWVQGSGSTQCTGTGEVSLQLREPKPIRVHVYPRAAAGRFEMLIKRGPGGDASPVRFIVRSAGPRTRCCRGSQSWPPTPRPPRRGKALLDVRVAMGVRAPGTVSGARRRDAAVDAHLFRYQGYALDVEPCCAYGPRFKRTTLAFAVDVLQSGRRIGWMSTGLRCLVRRGGLGLRCDRVGYRKGP